MRHPVEKYNQIQLEELAELSGREREARAFFYRIGNAAYCYQFQFSDVAGLSSVQTDSEPLDLLDWLEQQLATRSGNNSAHELLRTYYEKYLEGIPSERFREIERAKGLEEAKRSWPFRRYVLERNDFGMEEFMRINLSEQDYANWQELNES